jgi:hypothetical protein
VQKAGLKQTVLLQGGGVARKQYAVRGYPTSYWIDHQGTVIDKQVGFRASHVPAMERRIEKLLAAAKK